MSTTMSRDTHAIDFDMRPSILPHHHFFPAEPPDLPAWPDVAGNEEPTYLHPAVVRIAASGYAWMLLMFWIIFAGYGYMGFTLFIATMISGVMIGLLAVGGGAGRSVAPWQRQWRSFDEFLHGKLDVWGARISGRDAFIQLAALSWCLAGLATAFAIIIASVQT